MTLGERQGGYYGELDFPDEIQGPVRTAFESVKRFLSKFEARGRWFEVHEHFNLLYAGAPFYFLGPTPVYRARIDVELMAAHFTRSISIAPDYTLTITKHDGTGGTNVYPIAKIDGAAASAVPWIALKPYPFNLDNQPRRVKAGEVLGFQIEEANDDADILGSGLLSMYFREVGNG